MAAALIVIEIAAPKVSDDALAVLVSACSRAARDAECVLARNANEEQPAAVAIVTLQSEDKMRVEVGVRRGDHDSWRTKDFAFLPADQRMDRWRAVGFAIGTLAESNPAPQEETSTRAAVPPPPATTTTTSAPSSSAPTSSAPSSSAPTSSAPTSKTKLSQPVSPVEPESDAAEESPATATRKAGRAPGTQLFVGAAAIFGPGLEKDPPWRLGSALYADLALPEVPVFFTVGGSAATRLGSGSADVTTRWFDVWLGAGVPLLGHLGSSGLELRAQVLTEYFEAHASDGSGSQTDSRWTVGLQGVFGGRIQIVPDLLLTAELQAAGLSGETEISVGGQSVGTSASFRYLGSAGLRVQFR